MLFFRVPLKGYDVWRLTRSLWGMLCATATPSALEHPIRHKTPQPQPCPMCREKRSHTPKTITALSRRRQSSQKFGYPNS
ncbi:hypothetical protein [Microseira sp. BLCC-F43]|uniref:hypothetical protein n=1 Tax=Microseira sp. BLCC-F43 TaxID=3153602 RepID=UPI0035B90AB2